MRRWIPGTGWLAAAMLVSAGCNDPAHRQRIERRERSMAHTLRVAEQSEATRVQRMESTARVFGQRVERDAHQTDRMPKDVGWWFDREFRRWEERQPRFQREINRELDGNVPNIERTLPLFY